MRILLIAYDNGSFIHFFPLGLGYIASVLREAGYEVTIYQQDQHHWPESHLTHYLSCGPRFDIVGLGVIGGYYQYRKALAISEAITKLAPDRRPFYVLGGHGPSPIPEYFLEKTGADAVVLGEGEETMRELVRAYGEGASLANIPGLVLRRNGGFENTGERQPVSDLRQLPRPAYDMFPMDYYALLRVPHAVSTDRVGSLISARGCPFQCNFCLLYTSPSPRDRTRSRMPSSA